MRIQRKLPTLADLISDPTLNHLPPSAIPRSLFDTRDTSLLFIRMLIAAHRTYLCKLFMPPMIEHKRSALNEHIED